MRLYIPFLIGCSMLASCILNEARAQGQAATNTAIPQIFAPGAISTGDYESHPTFTPSGDTIFFVKSSPDYSTWTICVSYLRNKRWISPVVAPFSGKYKDSHPFVTNDGQSIYFISNRPINTTDSVNANFDIWKVTRTETGWSEPIHLEKPVNSEADEFYPTLTNNGTMYFASSRQGGKGSFDIYRYKMNGSNVQVAQNLGEAVNSADAESEPYISADEKYLLFISGRVNTNNDIYISYNQNGKWTAAEKLPLPFNSDATEFSPYVSRDNKYFFFSSTRNNTKGGYLKQESVHELLSRVRSPGNGLGDIYRVDLSALNLRQE